MKNCTENTIASFILSIPYAAFVVFTIEPLYFIGLSHLSDANLTEMPEALLLAFYKLPFLLSDWLLLGNQDKFPTDTWYEWLALGISSVLIGTIVILAVLLAIQKLGEKIRN